MRASSWLLGLPVSRAGGEPPLHAVCCDCSRSSLLLLCISQAIDYLCSCAPPADIFMGCVRLSICPAS